MVIYRICFFLLFTFLTVLASAQNFKARADSLYGAKNYAIAAPTYLKAAFYSDFRKLKAGNYYDAACCFALAGIPDSAFTYLQKAIELGWNNKEHLLKDGDLISLHDDRQWKKLVHNVHEPKTWTDDPQKTKLVTTDITNFWNAYDLAQKDTVNRLKIYREYYIDKGTAGLQDYFATKVWNMRSFVNGHDRRSRFYAAIRPNTLQVEALKPQIVASFVKFKEVYPKARFCDIYFVIGNYTSGGTVSPTGLLIGIDQMSRTDNIPMDELTLWEKNNYQPLQKLPHIIAHELIHFNQGSLSHDTTLLSAALVEGMCDFFAELISGETNIERQIVFAKGKEKQIWEDFKKEIWLNRGSNWIGNATQERPDHPADLGYWVGYIICKAYYEQAEDKKQAVWDILHISDYKSFLEKSHVEEYFSKIL
jgi:hypothetical protein